MNPAQSATPLGYDGQSGSVPVSKQHLRSQMMQNLRKDRPVNGTWLIVFLIALFPVVPMPIAGGTPIAISLIVLIVMTQAVNGRGFKLYRPEAIYLFFVILLIVLEFITLVRLETTEDANYFFGRVYWAILFVVIVAACNSNLSKGQTQFFGQILFFAIAILTFAMLLESTFYPRFEKGRDFGSLALPWPRATGVPNSDGKIGTFLCLCLGYFLYTKPQIPKWQFWYIGIGSVVGLGFTQSRSTLVAMAVTFGIWLVYKAFRARNAMTSLAIWLLFAGFAVVVATFFGEILNMIIGKGIFAANAMARVDHVAYGVMRVGDAPIFGSGASAIRQYEALSGIHNTALAMAVKSGIFAGALVITIILAPIVLIPGSAKLKFMASSICMGFLVEHMLYPGFINEFIVLAFVAVSVMAAMEKNDPQAKKTKKIRRLV